MTGSESLSRRALLRAVAVAGVWPIAACSSHQHKGSLITSRFRFTDVDGFKRRVLRTGTENGPRVLLLHELPGLSDDDLTLAHLLGDAGFNVYVPLMFGSIGQDSITSGYLQACRGGEFECGKNSTRSKVLDWLEPLCDQLVREQGPIAVIGMCLTGILPLALLRPGVAAAVVCQPTIPFSALRFKPTGGQKRDLGLGSDDLKRACASEVPFLAMRYRSDDLCPP